MTFSFETTTFYAFSMTKTTQVRLGEIEVRLGDIQVRLSAIVFNGLRDSSDMHTLSDYIHNTIA